jgi:hypothetical protein
MSVNQLLAQNPVQPYKICLVAGGKKRASHNLARPNEETTQQTFEAHTSHGYGAHESKTPEHKVHLENTNHIRH